jgi:adenylate cyclase
MSDSATPLSIEAIAVLCGCAPADIRALIALGLLDGAQLGPQSINGIRLILSLNSAGIGLETFAGAIGAGLLSLDFARHVLPDTIALSAQSYGEACAELGLDPALAHRLFIAAGLPAPEPARRAREDEIALLRLMATAVQRGIDEAALGRILRVFGHATRRIAEAMRDFFRSQIEAPLAAQGLPTAALMTAAAEHRVPLQDLGFRALRLLISRFVEDVVFENITMRIQDALAAAGLLEPAGPADPAVALVDLAGYAGLTWAQGDQAAAHKAAAFEALAQDALAVAGGRIIKSLGDGLLLLFARPDLAAPGCLGLMRRLAAAGLPEVHVGLTAGPVIWRDGDIFGHSVNLAARLAALAGPSEIVADAAALPRLGAAGAPWRPDGTVTPKGLAEIAIWRLDGSAARARSGAAPDE